MINLIAVAREDGYAFVQVNGSIFAVRPPYRDKAPVTPSIVERAISSYGFSAENRQFASWGELFDYLKAEFISTRRGLGYEEPDGTQIRRLVRRAPQSVVENYLRRIEDELVPNNELRAATSLLTSLLRNAVVLENTVLLERCTDLLERCQAIKEQREEEYAGLIDNSESLAEEFPLAVEYFGTKVFELSRSVRAEGQVLVVGAAN